MGKLKLGGGKKNPKPQAIAVSTLYDINKQLVKQLPLLTREEIFKVLEATIDKLLEDAYKGNYYMLLCNERKDYTVFHTNYKKTYSDTLEWLKKEVAECLHNRGDIYSIENAKDQPAIEIWIQPIDSEDPAMYVFFPYNQGVLEQE